MNFIFIHSKLFHFRTDLLSVDWDEQEFLSLNPVQIRILFEFTYLSWSNIS